MGMEMLLRPWRRALDANGRAQRAEYFLFLLQIGVIWFVTMAVGFNLTAPADPDAPMLEDGQLAFLLFLAVMGLLTLVLATIATIRRIHDFDQSGALVLLLLVGGWLALLIFGVIPGTVGPNRHGLDPRGRSGRIDNIFS